MGVTRVVPFQRSTATVNSAGETVLSYASSARVTGAWQPTGGSYVRFLGGTVVQIDALLIALGTLDVQVGDRCMDPSAGTQAARMEVVNVQTYGVEHTEIALKQLGR